MPREAPFSTWATCPAQQPSLWPGLAHQRSSQGPLAGRGQHPQGKEDPLLAGPVGRGREGQGGLAAAPPLGRPPLPRAPWMRPEAAPGIPWTSVTLFWAKYSSQEAFSRREVQKSPQSSEPRVSLPTCTTLAQTSKPWRVSVRFPSRQILAGGSVRQCSGPGAQTGRSRTPSPPGSRNREAGGALP